MNHTRITTLSLAVLALAACDSSRRAADTALAQTGAAIDTAMNRVDSAAGMVAGSAWTDASILGYATTANMDEINEGELAAKKATNAAVKSFARQMVTDHKTMLSDAKALATRLNMMADTTKDDVRDLSNSARDRLRDMTDKAAGKDWDADYIDHQIDEHQKVLEKLQDLSKDATNADVRAALVKATGKVQEHLTKAQTIKENQLKS